MKILLDECLSSDWAEYLRNEGFEAIHWLSIGGCGDEDAKLLEWATENDHAIITCDLDFTNLLVWRGLFKPSVVQLRSGDFLPDRGTGDLVVSVLQNCSEEIALGAIISIHIESRRARVKRLLEE